MKTNTYKSTGLMLILLSLTLSVTQCSEGEGMDQLTTLKNEVSEIDTLSQQLSEEEIRGILFMREEEKLARDVYFYLYEIHPLRPFSNISKSEQAHMDGMKYLIDTYDLVDPVDENPEGIFQNEELQQMYDELIEMGSKSREDALKVGALIEEVDIIDLQHELDSIAVNEDVRRVYQNLCNASENHLRAFVRVLRSYNVDYEPVKLEDNVFDRIISE
jgi:hypothetical protein